MLDFIQAATIHPELLFCVMALFLLFGVGLPVTVGLAIREHVQLNRPRRHSRRRSR